MNYEAQTGFLYLASGSLAFLLLFTFLRELGLRLDAKSGSVNSETSDWLGTDVLKIVGIRKETSDIKTFRLQRKNGGNFPNFKEGQFLSFQIGPAEDKVLRSYSISSSTMNPTTLDVSIKLLKDGVGSGWFHSLSMGDEVVAHAPSGLFTLGELKGKNDPLIFVAGGIGITPFLSMLKTLQDMASKTPVFLFYGARSENDLAFHQSLSLIDARNDWFTYVPVISGESKGWAGKTGFIGFDMISEISKNWCKARYFFCGPPILTDTVSEALVKNGVDEDVLHSEKFASPASMDLESIEPRDAKIEIDGKVLDYSGKLSLLEYFEDNNVTMSFACRSGVCGSCKCRVVSGEADVFSDSGLTRHEVKDGFIQTCVARPKTDLVLSRN